MPELRPRVLDDQHSMSGDNRRALTGVETIDRSASASRWRILWTYGALYGIVFKTILYLLASVLGCARAADRQSGRSPRCRSASPGAVRRIECDESKCGRSPRPRPGMGSQEREGAATHRESGTEQLLETPNNFFGRGEEGDAAVSVEKPASSFQIYGSSGGSASIDAGSERRSRGTGARMGVVEARELVQPSFFLRRLRASSCGDSSGVLGTGAAPRLRLP